MYLKGTFVVITSNVEKLSYFDKTTKITEIAKNTYRLTLAINVDFLSYYIQLQEEKQFQGMEMEIDYSGKTHPLAEER